MISRAAMATNQKVGCSSQPGRTIKSREAKICQDPLLARDSDLIFSSRPRRSGHFMIKHVTGDILDSIADAVVNTVQRMEDVVGGPNGAAPVWACAARH
jgi:hypothetical protein